MKRGKWWRGGKRPPSSYEVRCKILRHQDYFCPGCHRDIIEENSTLEHVIPRSKAKGWEGISLVYCASCNHRKADRAPYGCELVWLFAVNARIGFGPTCMETLAHELQFRLRVRTQAASTPVA